MSVEIRNIFKITDSHYDVEYNSPEWGWIPYTVDTALIDDPTEVIMKKIYQKILTMDAIDKPLEIVKVIPTLTHNQLLIGLVEQQWISEDEGEQWLMGILPQTILELINRFPVEQRFVAKVRATRPTVVNRDDPLVISLAALKGLDSNTMDEFFIHYAEDRATPAPL